MKYFFRWIICLVVGIPAYAQQQTVKQAFFYPGAEAKPWLLWYWMHAAVSKEGIRADLAAMKQAGIGGAYLVTIQDTSAAVDFGPVARQLSPEWFALVHYAMQEASRLGLQLGMHLSDGFSCAGGPWISPEESMQQVVWTKNYISPATTAIKLEQPLTREGFYKDIAVYAYPLKEAPSVIKPAVTTSTGTSADFLTLPGNRQSFKSESDCWIQYSYQQPFTVRSVQIETGSNNYPAQRLILQSSDNGANFRTVIKFTAARHGWKDNVQGYTYSVPATTAKYFRLVYEKAGAEPGAEDLDAAKWKPTLKVTGIFLNEEAAINGYEGKNGSIWRSSPITTATQVTDTDAIPLANILTLTDKLSLDGTLRWKAPPGHWMIVRIGHTSTGEVNYTGGAGKGLECDKFSAAAINKQFDNWFAKIIENTDPALANQVLKVLYVDSWECGSQNWTDRFPTEFRQRRGYDLMPYLPLMAGIPVESAAVSEKVLHDVRQTIADLISEVFFKTLAARAHEKGCRFSTESVAPVMMGDGILHYKYSDIPMGEFWNNSPTHDKPNDMQDAISGAHLYGKNIVQAEAFTTLRMDWNEHPGALKITGDRNLALGVNRMVMHVFAHNPWLNKRPGMTLDGVGLYYQRDQTWFKQSKAWIDYITRCQSLLQLGHPVTDIAVFTGEELPRRSLTPDRLVNTFPEIFGEARVESEKQRLANKGQPMRSIPEGVTHSANMADPEKWIDALHGYAYDSFNPDALLQMTVKNGRVVLPGGGAYWQLVFPQRHPLMPDAGRWSVPVAQKLLQLAKAGANILLDTSMVQGIGLKDDDIILQQLFKEIWQQENVHPLSAAAAVLEGLKDVNVRDSAGAIAWTHRSTAKEEVYFLSNQTAYTQKADIRFRWEGTPTVLDPITGEMYMPGTVISLPMGTRFTVTLAPAQSLFVVFSHDTLTTKIKYDKKVVEQQLQPIAGPWQLQFDTANGGPAAPLLLDSLISWTQFPDQAVKYYSGTAVYRSNFNIATTHQKKQIHLCIDSIFNIVKVTINGIDCGTRWTPPYELDITKAIKPGTNKIEMTVTNTWHNRLIGDHYLPENKRITYTTAPYRFKDETLAPAGITGNVQLKIE
ncbi:glycosyl hydrolase [Chitinophaga sp. Cy-1792]|uniref:glycosyl hydrolase n=1 Tax=Chitinophaga sp. Cy-1792 TaxID=2608339 RepID=UPI00141EF663|nr:glycosyl hydrolase [Chitinophaga sp. Cy-1792]NIG55352.1 DNA-binding protein [Chitinophaga sp. Cy-1792]